MRFSNDMELIYGHGTIIRTGITCKKILCYTPTHLAGDLLLKMLKYFEVKLKIFNSRESEKM